MSLIDIDSYNSTWRGYDYYKADKVLFWKPLGENEYEGSVSGSTKEPYSVKIDVFHPKKSFCNCPFAEGSRKVCKHKVALYFTVFPEEAEEYWDRTLKAAREQEEYEEHIYDLVDQRILNMSKEELQCALFETLADAPEWVFDRFVANYIDE